MKQILVTQRVDSIGDRAERRDALDQRWFDLMQQAGLQAVVVPNNLHWVQDYLADGVFDGLLLTGGNSLMKCGGDAAERDEVERLLLNSALENGVPVLGICRGMQIILDHYGATLEPITGHVAAEQTIEIEGESAIVNSYHDWGTSEAPAELDVWARAVDGIVKAIRHKKLPVCGVMWHPERISPFRPVDVALIRGILGQEASA